ncbi:MAG TPA: glycosyltransferase [Trebonia sp.]|nr:glycosyltransferase [Trebonia sp.]
MSTIAPQTRHTVTAIIVAHDGARLLPDLVRALKAQTYPVEQTVAVDTASRDRSGAVLAELIGQDAVFGMHRSTGYGEAVTVALRHATRRRSGLTDPNIARIEWIWLLHDDCEPAADALEKLLRAASKDRSVAVLGPKVLDGQDRRTLREVGVSIDRAGRRVTGIDPGEIDQGQHDHKRDVLAVGSAGMLVRRDLWDRLGGFDSGLKLFRDDVDFCWRAQAAGFRVQVVTDAVLYHRELSARRRRPTEGGSARQLDRRNALFVLAVNLPLLTMLWVLGGCITGSLARAFYFLLTKQLDLASAYAFSVLSLLGHPIRLIQGRRRRARGHAAGYNAVRVFIPPARTLFRVAERIAALISNGPPKASGGRHQASGEESEEDEQFVDTQSVMRRIIGHPGVQLFAGLLIVSLVAERRLLGTSPLGGGALVPAWGGSAALWHEYLAGFHAVSVGSTASAPPYLAVVAALATVLGGQAWLAVDVLLLGCVPLAGLTAYLGTRWLVTAAPARVLLAAAYALLPVATGAVAAGRLGTAVAYVLLPLIAVSAGRMLTAPPRQARRAAWAVGLLTAVAAAFAPLAWVLAVVFAAAALGARRWLVAVHPVNAAIVAVTPFFVLFPWSLHLLSSPSAFLSEAGLSAQGLTTRGLSPSRLFTLSPGGPGLPPSWVTAGFALALVALLFSAGTFSGRSGRAGRGGSQAADADSARPDSRIGLVIAGWSVAVAGLLTATLVSRVSVTPAGGGEAADAWPGVALALAALGLLIASAPAAQRLAQVITSAGQPGGRAPYGPARRALAVAALAAAASAPLLVACYWVKDGVRGPVSTIAAPLLPAFVSASSTSGEQYRTLILRPDSAGALNYTVVRQGDPSLGEPELGTASAAGSALAREVAALAAPDGADAGDPGLVLGDFGIRYVLLPGPVSTALAQRLDAAIGLVALSKAPGYDLWQVAGTVARVRVVAADGITTALPSGTVNMNSASAPASGGTLVLAEPFGGWTATLNGHALKPLAAPVDGWAQGFVLPSGGGQLSIVRDNLARVFSLIAELFAVLAVCVLALPGKRTDPVEEAEALLALREAKDGKRAADPAGRNGRPGRAVAGHRAGGGADRPGSGRRGRTAEEPAPAREAEPALAAAGATAGFPAATGAGTERASLSAAGWEFSADAALSRDDPFAADDSFTADAGFPGDAGFAGDDRASAAGPGVLDARGPAAVVGPADAGTAARAVTGLPADRVGTADWAGTADTADSADRVDSADQVGAADRAETSGLAGPWDMAGEWGSPVETGALGAWAVDPLEDGGQHDARDWLTGPQAVPPLTAPQFVPRLTGQQPQVPDDVSAEADKSETPAPRETGPQLPPWESGPQPPVSATGGQPRSPWETTGYPPAAPAGLLPRHASSSGPQSPVPATGGQPRHPWESGPQAPVPPAGAAPVERAPWESSDWDWSPASDGDGSAGDSTGNDSPAGTAALPAQPAPEPASGSGPAASRPARSERHSHRGGKHGRPSRWRGTGNRSGGDGES